MVRLLWRIREDPRVELGASPRAGLLLLRAAKAHAMMQGRDHALPDDVQALAVPVLAHRLLPSADAMVGRELPDQVLAGIVRRLPPRLEPAGSWVQPQVPEHAAVLFGHNQAELVIA